MESSKDIFRQTLLGEAQSLDVAISSQQLEAMCLHYELICKWNPKVRLVGNVDPRRVAIELFGDCLVANKFIDSILSERSSEGPLSIIDIGAGGGLPGIPIKILRPEWKLTLIDVNAKKISFAKTLAREVNLVNTTIVRGRAESLAHNEDMREQYDLAFCRAVAAGPIVCELSAPFLKIGGRFIAQLAGESRGEDHSEEGENLGKAAQLVGATIGITKSYKVEPEGGKRLTIEIIKVSATPEKYPRDYKKIVKKPLA